MLEPLLLVGLAIAVWVGFNIGGATTAPAFGPAIGANLITKVAAAALMSVAFFLGAWTIGREVVDTLGRQLVHDTAIFTLEANVAVLFFIGGALFLGNYAGVPASTSMTAVGAIAALGFATGELNWAVMGEIVVWWIVAPIIGFWVGGVIGRYLYTHINEWLAIERDSAEETMLRLERRGGVLPWPVVEQGTSRRELGGALVVVLIGGLMGFSSGTSNIANAIAPIYGAGAIEMSPLIVIGSVAVAIGAFTIARRTLDTVGNDITNLPLTAALVVAVVSSVIVIFLSAIGIPASFVVIATMTIVGLGWGRATRTTRMRDAARGEAPAVSVGALTAEQEGEEAPEIGAERRRDIPQASDLFRPETTARVIIMQNVVPIISTVGAYLTFRFVPIFGL